MSDSGPLSWSNLPWSNLRRATPARIGLGRTGSALTTAAHLDFQRAHARARDAVHAALDVQRILGDLGEIGVDAVHLRSAAGDRPTYLRRPDLGRRLDGASRRLLQERPAALPQIVFVVADGLSATAANAHAVALLKAMLPGLAEASLRVGPVAIVEGGRVAIGDEIGGMLGAELVAVLIGERPGLSAADSLGIYVTWQPALGVVDAARNCLSNIRPNGMPIPEAAEALRQLIAGARYYRMTGVALSQLLADDSDGRFAARLGIGLPSMPVYSQSSPLVAVGHRPLDRDGKEPGVRVRRMVDGPIISPDLHPSIGVNIQGPSLIRVPDWIEGRLGDYYLYFADHKGRYIRLAYADRLTGPWTIHPPGSLQLEQSGFLTEPPDVTPEQFAELEARYRQRGAAMSHDLLLEVTTPHIASPDVHVDPQGRQIVMYFHGLDDVGTQVTRVAASRDGIDFTAHQEVLGRSYMRIFEHGGMTYALAMPGELYRSTDGFHAFEAGPSLFNPNMRHSALLKRGSVLWVFWTQVGETPERILASRIDLSGDWRSWQEDAAIEVLRPEHAWEGADAPLVPSVRSTAYGLVNQLRDPAIFEENGRTYLLYAVAGESGIAIADIVFDD